MPSGAPLPSDELTRVAALHALRILDTPREESFDRIAAMAARMLEAPIAAISLVDTDREWYKGQVGECDTQAPRDEAFCAYTILGDGLFLVEDAAEDPRFTENPQVVGKGVRFYAGAPLRTKSGHNIGALCVKDTRPRTLTKAQRQTLLDLARVAAQMLELRLAGMALRERALQLVEARQAALDATTAKSEFLANMSHELRTPLTAVLGCIELLRDESAPMETRHEWMRSIHRNGEHLLTLIDDILDLARIESGRLQIHEKDVCLGTVLRDIERVLSGRAAGKWLGFRVEIDKELPLWVRTDPTRLRQILFNLVGNAIKFTERGEVRITAAAATEAGPLLRVDVADTGIGIDSEQVGRLFESFAQADASTTRRFGGAGLGLSISQRLAEALGGRITVQSEPGKGSTFTLWLELRPAEQQSVTTDVSEEAIEAVEAVRTIAGRVLLAEDGPDNQRLVAFHLRRAGAEVDIANNGREALEMVSAAMEAQRPYSLVLMDMQMPELDGYGATRELRRRGVRTPIVALTAHAMPGDRERCLQAGCDDYVTKPVSRDTLLRACATWLSVALRSVA